MRKRALLSFYIILNMLFCLVAPSMALASKNQNNPDSTIESCDCPGSPFVRMGVITGKNVGRNMLNSRSPGRGINTSARQLKTPEFVFGNLVGGLMGASLGSMIPLASMVGVTGIFAKMLNIFPIFAGISIIGSLVSNSITQIREDRFSFSSVFNSIDWLSKVAGITGSAIGFGIGSLFLPSPFLGSFVASLLVGWLMTKLVMNCRSVTRDGNSIESDSNFIEKEKNKEINGSGTPHNPLVSQPIKSSNIGELKARLIKAYERLMLTIDSSGKTKALQEYRSVNEKLQKAVRSELISY